MQYIIREKDSLGSRELAIEDRHQHRLLRVHGPLVRVRDELRVDDAQGVEQLWIKEPVLSDGTTFEIYRGASQCARVNMLARGNLLEGFDMLLAGGEALRARGDLVGREFTISGSGGRVARVHRHDQQATEVETAAGQDEVLLLAGVVAMAAMSERWARAATRTS